MTEADEVGVLHSGDLASVYSAEKSFYRKSALSRWITAHSLLAEEDAKVRDVVARSVALQAALEYFRQ